MRKKIVSKLTNTYWCMDIQSTLELPTFYVLYSNISETRKFFKIKSLCTKKMWPSSNWVGVTLSSQARLRLHCSLVLRLAANSRPVCIWNQGWFYISWPPILMNSREVCQRCLENRQHCDYIFLILFSKFYFIYSLN